MISVDELDLQAQASLEAGDRLVARGYWRRATRIAPDRLDLWLKLLAVTDAPAERKRCLEQIVRLDDSNPDFRRELDEILRAEQAQSAAPAVAVQPTPVVETPSETRTVARPDVTDEMRLEWDRAAAEGKALVCINHPQVKTTLRCNSCGVPICARCAVRTPVGFRCRACIRAQQAIFYTAEWYDYPLAALVALLLSTPAAVLTGLAGWWFALIISPLAGGLIGSACHLVVGRRRGRWTWLVVAISMGVGAAGAVLVMPGSFLSIGIYAVLGVGAAMSVLRLGRSR